MDKYHGVYVKIVLSNNDTVKGHIYGKDESGNLILKNVSTERANGYNSKEDMLPILTTLIKDLEVLDMNAEKPQTAAPVQQEQQQQEQHQLKQQQQFQQFQQQQQQQQHQHQFQQMQQLQQQPHPFHHPMQFPVPPPPPFHHQPSPHMLPNPVTASHIDPAMLFHQQQQQMHISSPHLPRDPAILSSQQDQQQINSPSSMNNDGVTSHRLDPAVFFSQKQQPQQQQQSGANGHATNIDPAILFTQGQEQQQQSKQQQNKNRENKSTIAAAAANNNEGERATTKSKVIDPAILFSQNLQQQQSPNHLVQKMFQQQQQNEGIASLKSLDPSIFFQQQQPSNDKKPTAIESPATSSSSTVPFQDPAIISTSSRPDIGNGSPGKPKKPLFGGKKAKKPVKEVVVFEDYSEFEIGKGKKVSQQQQQQKKTIITVVDNGNKSNSGSNNSSTPSTPKKQQSKTVKSLFEDAVVITSAEQQLSKQSFKKHQSPVVNENTTLSSKQQQKQQQNKGTATISTPPIEILTKQSAIPASLIPPKARRSGSSTSSSSTIPQQQQANRTVIEPTARILTVSGGIQIPTVSTAQMENVKLIAKETGLTQTQLIENGALGISMMVLKAIGGHRRIQPDNHNAAPVVVILAGPTVNGEFGIAAARHLANRGCQVIISLVTIDHSRDTTIIEQYKALAQFSGVRFVEQISELPNQFTQPVDIIVDALVGGSSSNLLSSSSIKNHIHWANVNKAPVLSIDFPSGVHPDKGVTAGNNFIRPKWTLCLGAPYTGCTSRNITGELFLADAGLPLVCFQKSIGAGNNFHIPWDSDFVLALEYAS